MLEIEQLLFAVGMTYANMHVTIDIWLILKRLWMLNGVKTEDLHSLTHFSLSKMYLVGARQAFRLLLEISQTS